MNPRTSRSVERLAMLSSSDHCFEVTYLLKALAVPAFTEICSHSRCGEGKRGLIRFHKLKLAAIFSLPEQKVHRELIVYQSLWPPSVLQHFQKSSLLKTLNQLNLKSIWRLLRTRERKFVQMVLVT